MENLQQELEEEVYYGLPATNYDREPTCKTYAFHSATEESAIVAVERENRLKQRIKVLQSKIERIDRAISALNATERLIITERYLEGKQWWQVAYKVQYNERWCREIRKRAVHKVAIGLFGEEAQPEYSRKTARRIG